MSRYYDEESVDCSRPCGYLGEGFFPSGEKYKACQFYGYILHPAKGVSPEHCRAFTRPEVVQAMRKAQEERLQAQRKKKNQ